MQMMRFLLTLAHTLFVPFKETHQIAKVNAHSRFYKQGFMSHEVDALQSIFHGKAPHQPPKQK